MLKRAATAVCRQKGGCCFAISAPYARCLSSATGAAGKSSNTGAAATSGNRVNEQDVKAVADKAAASAGKSATKPKGQRKHLQPTGTEGAAPWSAATAGSDPTTIGRGEAAGGAGHAASGSAGQSVSFGEGQGEGGGAIRGGVASARAAATPGPDTADLVDADNVGPDVAGAGQAADHAVDGSAAASATRAAAAGGAGAKTGKGGRKISRAQDAAAAVGGNIGQPMGPVVSSAGVRCGGGAAGGGASGSGAGGGAGGSRSYHTAAASSAAAGPAQLTTDESAAAARIPAAEQRERGNPIANTSNASLWEREDVGRSRLLGGVHVESSDGDTPSLHRDPSNCEAVPFRPADERSDRDFGVLTEDAATHEPRFLQRGETQRASMDVADPHVIREAIDAEAETGDAQAQAPLLASLFPGASPHLTDFASDREAIVWYNLLGDPGRDAYTAAVQAERPDAPAATQRDPVANKNPNAGPYRTVAQRERDGF